MVNNKAKSKIKWRLIWTAYLLIVIPVAVPALIFCYLLIPFSWMVEVIVEFKRHLIEKYKPEERI